MVRASKFFSKEAAKAERAATTGDRASEQFVNVAEAFRAQVGVLKQKNPRSRIRAARWRQGRVTRANRTCGKSALTADCKGAVFNATFRY